MNRKIGLLVLSITMAYIAANKDDFFDDAYFNKIDKSFNIELSQYANRVKNRRRNKRCASSCSIGRSSCVYAPGYMSSFCCPSNYAFQCS
uniref:Uncharacterized protein n=1 Tax=Acrobeloides nanus TaxID=290746 RepID=A0A914DW13_9BILA